MVGVATQGGLAPGTGTDAVPISFYAPVSNYKQGFGYTGTGHRSDDLIVPAGTVVRAAAPGTVSFVGNDGAMGDAVKITHKQGYVTIYGNLQNIQVKVGDNVRALDQIAQSDGRRNSPHPGDSTGPHLPFQIIHNGVNVNPAKYIEGAGNADINDPIGKVVSNAVTAVTSPLDAVTTFLGELSKPAFWIRVGLGALGVTLLTIALIKILSTTSTGQTAIAAGKDAAKVALLA